MYEFFKRIKIKKCSKIIFYLKNRTEKIMISIKGGFWPPKNYKMYTRRRLVIYIFLLIGTMAIDIFTHYPVPFLVFEKIILKVWTSKLHFIENFSGI